ncbi:MAG: prepilin-type N-terminal cleavage/methylation domain-containing protein [Kiritimatiellae bacterium]|nr:prepilin-type N-terminal cleavage/methylation domain-containing protein [Verrucomicrobiota bacterium]MBU4289625.1 prepilin-type N-terminal cleavage/methylation domain-containing protein [Verrucomicrobiota bacterium]MCG2680219.1 prepilin-type N-terminal cleavage/methylation domain-containing protein [Kiritimatiellia bacterium]
MKKGFTLVEIMIVVAIIGLLAAIAIPSFMRARTTSQANACINNLRQIESAKDQYALEAGLTNLALMDTHWVDIGPTTNVAGGYIKAWPLCPASTSITSRTTAYQALTEYDYTINPIGSNAACRRLPDATPAHRL